MELYSYIKIIHTISAAFLFGTSALLFCYCLWTYLQNDKIAFSYALSIAMKINITVIAGCGILQLITGFTLIYLEALHFTTDWIAGVLSAYSIATLCWLSGIHLLGHCHQRLVIDESGDAFTTDQIKKPFFIWILLCLIAIGCMLILYNLMTIPELP